MLKAMRHPDISRRLICRGPRRSPETRPLPTCGNLSFVKVHLTLRAHCCTAHIPADEGQNMATADILLIAATALSTLVIWLGVVVQGRIAAALARP
jgi:hypothetical protein